ncbi:hypothetical protein [Pseudomonas phage DL62]|uniref:Uncharacterized protein n=1 Tax=Pseudomonas phage DL62 TaxID=1640972 RepID=A0A0F6YPN7_9CAUD|nr:hypothetical protein AVU26_gp01 [Pseudomonas phage DL62]AKF13916.1 hypothetical protein [Pseudomonas phage DL62]
MLSRQDRGERAWHQQDAAWQRQIATWAAQDHRHYAAPWRKRQASQEYAVALTKHREALERSRHYGQPKG